MIRGLPKLLTRTIHKIEENELQFRLEVDITDKVSIIALVSALIIGSSVVAIILSIIGIKKFVLK